MVRVQAECGDCRGTGLYQGFAEREGEPVVCLGCDGTGAKMISYTPYTGRKLKKGVRIIRRSRGSFVGTGVGGKTGSEMTYQEFQQMIPEARVES